MSDIMSALMEFSLVGAFVLAAIWVYYLARSITSMVRRYVVRAFVGAIAGCASGVVAIPSLANVFKPFLG